MVALNKGGALLSQNREDQKVLFQNNPVIQIAAQKLIIKGHSLRLPCRIVSSLTTNCACLNFEFSGLFLRWVRAFLLFFTCGFSVYSGQQAGLEPTCLVAQKVGTSCLIGLNRCVSRVTTPPADNGMSKNVFPLSHSQINSDRIWI